MLQNQTSSSEIIYLTVSFQEKEQVKSLGAKWDAVVKKWYIPIGIDVELFKFWLPDISPENTSNLVTLKLDGNDGIGLADLMTKIGKIIVSTLPSNVWIKAEISQFRRMGEHIAIELVEHDNQGLLMARAKSFLWQYNVGKILGKFKLATGFDLAAGIKVMLLVKTEFNKTYGINLIIQDIDPTYTIGDIEVKLKYIRDNLTKEDIINRNQHLPRPQEFCCVAVISPDNADTYKDFKSGADILNDLGICKFNYFSAKFQGIAAAIEIKNCLLAVLDLQKKTNKYDAICIIRGGGSPTDLYWLNDLELARVVCMSVLPVFTGIGHEPDSTILDEIANSRFDTPSKVIGHIRDIICSNTHTAAVNYQQIMLNSQQQISWAEQTNEAILSQIQNQALQQINDAEHQIENLAGELQPSINRLLSETDVQVEKFIHFIESKTISILYNTETQNKFYIDKIQNQALQQINDAEHQIEKHARTLQSSALSLLSESNSKLEQSMHLIESKVHLLLLNSQAQLDQYQNSIIADTFHLIDTSYNATERAYHSVFQYGQQQLERAIHNVESFGKEILGISPYATLNRGFAIVRDINNIPIVSSAQAKQQLFLNIEFRDGIVTVKPISNGENND